MYNSCLSMYSIAPETEIMSGVQFGETSQVFTPAYWKMVADVRIAGDTGRSYKLGITLQEEVTACLLGGYGVLGEVGVAAFQRVRERGVFDREAPTAEELSEILSEPLLLNGKLIRYRFPRQKARYIAGALRVISHAPMSTSTAGRTLREWLTSIPGIGNKTASWIARNWLDADDVAILDIHIHRAGVLAGFLEPNADVTKQYVQMEAEFLQFSNAIGVRPSELDNLIWNELRKTPTVVRDMLVRKGVKASDRCGLPPAKQRATSPNYLLFADA